MQSYNVEVVCLCDELILYASLFICLLSCSHSGSVCVTPSLPRHANIAMRPSVGLLVVSCAVCAIICGVFVLDAFSATAALKTPQQR